MIVAPAGPGKSADDAGSVSLSEIVAEAIQLLSKVEADTTLKKKLSAPKLKKLKQQLVVENPLSQSEAQQRRNALLELGESGDERALSLIEECEKDDWETVRAAVAIAVSTLGDPRGLPILLRLMIDRSMEVERETLKALRAFPHPLTVKPLLCLGLERPQLKLQLVDAITQVGADAVPVLLDVVQANDRGMVFDGIFVLGRIGDESAVPVLLRILDHSSGPLRAYAIEALGRIGSKQAAPKLVELLGDPDEIVRLNAVVALSKIPDQRAVRPLMQLLGDQEPEIRRRAVEALGEAGDARAVEPILQLLPGADDVLQDTIVDALANIGDAQAADALVPLLAGGRLELQLRILNWIKKAKPAGAAAQVLQLLQHPSPLVRRHAVQALGAIADVETIAALGEVLTRDSSFEVRAAAAKVFGRLGNAKATVPLLEMALRDEATVRCAAVISLGSLADASAAPALLAMLRDPAPEVRYHAVAAVGKLGLKQVASSVKPLLEDADPMVRKGAEKSLAELGVEKPHIGWFTRAGRVIDKFVPDAVAGSLPGKSLAIGLIVALTAGLLGSLFYWKSSTTETARKSMTKGAVLSFAAIGDSQLAVTRTRGELEIWDISAGSISNESKAELSSEVIALGKPLKLYGLVRGKLLAWDYHTAAEPDKSQALPIGPTLAGVTVSADGSTALFRTSHGCMAWDIVAQKTLCEVEVPTRVAPAISGDGKFIVAVSKEKKLIVISTATGETTAELAQPADGVKGLFFDDSGSQIVAAFGTHVLKINLGSGEDVQIPVSGALNGMTTAGPGKLVGFSGDNVIRVDLETKAVDTWAVSESDVTIRGIAVLDDGKYVAVRGDEKKVFWVVATSDGSSTELR